MELDEMKLAWHAMEPRLDKQETFRRQMVRTGRLDKMRHGLRPLVLGQMAQMLFGLLVASVAVALWTTGLQVTHLLVCDLLVQLYGVLLMALSARALYLVRRIDYAAPVVVIQRQLADLRAWRVRVEAPFNAVLGCFIWILALWMNLAWYGIDLWSPGFIGWAIASGWVGLMVIVTVVWLMHCAGLGRRMEDHATGRSVQQAETMLAEITCFEQE